MTTSDDLVVGSGVGWEPGRGETKFQDSQIQLPEVAKPAPIQTIQDLGGGVPQALPRPQSLAPAAQAEPCSGWALRPPSHGHRIPEHPSVLSLILQGHPRPRCPAELRRSGPWGIGELATRRRGSGATAPSPPRLRRTRPRCSVLAVAGRGRTRLQASHEGGDRPAPSDRSGLATGWLGRRGEESEPSFPGRGARHPTPLLLRRQLPTPARA